MKKGKYVYPKQKLCRENNEKTDERIFSIVGVKF